MPGEQVLTEHITSGTIRVLFEFNESLLSSKKICMSMRTGGVCIVERQRAKNLDMNLLGQSGFGSPFKNAMV